MPGPLDGVRILDLSAVISGPLAATLLSDQGADVLKIEAPGLGDILRYVGTHRGGMSGLFHVINRGKRAMTLDLRDERGKEVLRELARRSDVVIQNFRPGVVDRMGIGYDDLRKENPDLIYVSISGFGRQGPYSQQRVYDNVIQAYSGLCDTQGTGPENPQLVRQLICDKLTANTAAQAITAALFARERGRGGQHIELAMLDTAVQFLWPDAAANHTILEPDVEQQPTIGSRYALMAMSDGFATATPLTDSEFQGLCRAFDRDDVANDPRFATVAGRMQHLEALTDFLQKDLAEAAAAMPRAEAEKRLHAHDVPAGVVRTLSELPDDPQIRENGTLEEADHPQCGRIRQPRPAPRFHGTPAQSGGPAPLPGQDTDAVLEQIGWGARSDELREAGVVA
ncbi:MAG: CoA transferase [Myxococcota bacterium]